MSNRRRRLTGRVVAANSAMTVTVRVDRTYRHRLYEKVLRGNKRYMAHDELGAAVGDQVQIVESRPISKRKHWAVEKILSEVEST